MKQRRNKSNGFTRHMWMLPVLLVAVVALVLGGTAPNCWADDDDEIRFDVADVYAELNDTDGDLGFHALIDGEAWKYLEIEDPRERKMLYVFVRGRLKRQGLTELFFESAEPPFDSDDSEEVTLTPEEFFRRFPRGWYEIEGMTLEGEELESEDFFKHIMPATPDRIRVNRQPAAEDCDAAELPSVGEGDAVIISWNQVTTSHPDIGTPNNAAIDIAGYQFVVEWENEVAYVFSVDLPKPPEEGERMRVRVSPQFITAGIAEGANEFKFEILAIEASGNRTAIESCFEVEEPEE